MTKKPPSRPDDAALPARALRALARLPHGVRALARTWQGLVILLVVGSQLLLPLHYYTRRKDPHDERFAWRMFSPMRMTRCDPVFSVDRNPINLATEFHEAWIELAKRGRFGVIEKMGAALCAKHPGSEVHVVVECKYVGKPDATWGGYDMCKVPEL